MTTVPFESSSYYRVLWANDRDLTNFGDRQGANHVYGKNITWNELVKIIDNLESVADFESNQT